MPRLAIAAASGMPARGLGPRWRLLDAGGRPVATGVYFAAFQVAGQTFRRKFAVLR